MGVDWEYIACFVIIGLLGLYGAFKNFRPHRLEGGYNLGGKLRYWSDKLLGIKGLPEIVEVKFLGVVTTDIKRGGFMGAMLGSFWGGDLGMVVGGLAPKNSKMLCRFAVRYDNGEVKLMDCYKGSELYKKYMSYVCWEDL